MTHKELLTAFLGKTLNQPIDSLASLLFKKGDDDKLTDDLTDDALEQILTLDAARVKSLRDSIDTKGIFDNGYKKGQKEAFERFESDLKKNFTVESDKTGLDLVREVVSKSANPAMDADKVKAHPSFLELESRLNSQLSELKTAYEQQITDIKTGFERQQTLTGVKSQARDLFTAMNPVLSPNPQIAARQIEDFLDKFSGYEYSRTADGKMMVMKDGKRLEDNHGNPVFLDSLVKQEGTMRFDFAAQSDKGNAGNRNTDGAQSPFTVPRSEEEFAAAIFKATTAEERLKIETAFEAVRAK
jgi:hypothetical protein